MLDMATAKELFERVCRARGLSVIRVDMEDDNDAPESPLAEAHVYYNDMLRAGEAYSIASLVVEDVFVPIGCQNVSFSLHFVVFRGVKLPYNQAMIRFHGFALEY